MNARLSIAAIAAHLRTLPALAGIRIGTGYDRDYLTAFAKTWPAVWIAAQRMTRIDDGRGFSGCFRQHCKVDIAVRLVVQRYADGSVDAEQRLNALHDAVADALKDWTPPGADEPLVWESAQDGDSTESLMTADLIFSTTVTYARDA